MQRSRKVFQSLVVVGLQKVTLQTEQIYLLQNSPCTLQNFISNSIQSKSSLQFNRFISNLGKNNDALNKENKIQQAQQVLDCVNVVSLRKKLAELAVNQLILSKKDLIGMCREIVGVQADSDVNELVSALHKSGTVLIFQEIVFLRPEEVAEIVIESIPNTETEVQQRISELQKELLPLQESREKIEKYAEFWTHTFVWGGFFMLSMQFVLFIYYTYYTYSWDTMEPITYFVGQLFMLLGYLYFLTTKEDFAFQNLASSLKQFFWGNSVKQAKFDQERYRELVQEIARWTGYLRKLKLKAKLT